jgi:glycosyltransferase involved in cell wall biosynthesis
MGNRGAKEMRGLVVGPFPPPIGGDTVLTANLFKSRYWRDHGARLERVDVSPGAGIRVPDERLHRRDVQRGARILFEVLWKLPRTDFVLLWGNSRFISTVGLAIVCACAALRRPVFVKPFGSSLGERISHTPSPWREVILSVLRRSTLLLPETRSLASEFVEQLTFPKERVLWLPSFLPDAALGGARPARRFTGKCAFFGHVKKEKGVFDIVDALRVRPALSCDFYGPLLDRDREAFLSEISKTPNLGYRGVLESSQVRDAMRRYDALLLPTYHSGEGYPAVVLEAFASGLPVVASRWRSLPEIIEDGVNGLLVPPQAPHRLREALDRLAVDAPLYEALSANAFERAKSFSESSIVDGVLIPNVESALRRRGVRE